MAVDSHIVLPKFIIKKFRISQDNGNLYVLDIKECKRYEDGYTRIGTKYGYYKDRIENILCKDFEKPISSIFIKIQNADSIITFSQEEIEEVKNFFVIEFFRKPNIHKQVQNGLVFKDIIKTSPSTIISKIDEKSNNKALKDNILVKERYPLILINETDVPFVVSLTGIVLMTDGKRVNLYLPFSPTRAIWFVEIDEWVEKYGQAAEAAINQNEVKMVEHFNKNVVDDCMKEFENADEENKELNIYKVISNDLKEIERLENYLKNKTK